MSDIDKMLEVLDVLKPLIACYTPEEYEYYKYLLETKLFGEEFNNALEFAASVREKTP